MEEIKVGEYVRTSEGYIGLLIEINRKNYNYLTVDTKRDIRRDAIYPRSYLYLKNENITKHSFNIIDLIEVGDYVNGYKVDFVQNNEIIYNHNHPYKINMFARDIKTIVTHEQMKSIEYEVK